MDELFDLTPYAAVTREAHFDESTPRFDPPGREAPSDPDYPALVCGPRPTNFPPEEIHELARSMISDRAEDESEAGDHPSLASGYTYFGQFLAHDLSSARFGPDGLRNHRSPRLDLDSVYGSGRRLAPWLFEGARFVTGGRADPLRGAARDLDLVRTWPGKAVVTEPRNDENVMISQLHLAILHAHNAWLDRTAVDLGFREAGRTVRHAVQWLTVNDYLPRVLHESSRQELEDVQSDPAAWLSGKRLRDPKRPFRIPLEFLLAGFRFGHSMVRSRYALNERVFPPGLVRSDPLGDPNKDLFGDRDLPDDWTIDWSFFFPSRDPAARAPQPSRRIDTRITREFSLFPRAIAPHLPLPEGERWVSLAYVTLCRGEQLGLADGRSVADAVSVRTDTSPATTSEEAFAERRPLWYALLHEAELEGGTSLGPVGSRLVLDVVLGAILSDPDSYLLTATPWSPTTIGFPADFTVGDLVRFGQKAGEEHSPPRA